MNELIIHILLFMQCHRKIACYFCMVSHGNKICNKRKTENHKSNADERKKSIKFLLCFFFTEEEAIFGEIIIFDFKQFKKKDKQKWSIKIRKSCTRN